MKVMCFRRMVFSLWLAMPGLVAGDALWTEDFDEAATAAKAQNRFMLLNFTGSDWCGWCIKLDKEVFSKSEFKQYAKDNLACVIVDFPVNKSQSSKTKERNAELQKQYGVQGYPTIIVLNPGGEKVAQTGYKPGGPDAYVAHLKELIAPHAGSFGPVKAAAPVVNPATDARSMRTWTSSAGTTVEARYEQRRGNTIELRKANGAMIRIDVSSLSTTDQEFLRAIKAIP